MKLLSALCSTFVVALAGLLLGGIATPALAALPAHHHSTQRGAKCKAGYRRERRGKKVSCVKKGVKRRRAARTAPAPGPAIPEPSATPTGPLTSEVTFHAHLDPAYHQNPLAPYEVTYTFSASATRQNFINEATPVGGEERVPLPEGSLALRSDGKPECSVMVGSPVDTSTCTVHYDFELGRHVITVTYTNGAQSATENTEEDLKPMPTRPILAARYSASGYWNPTAIEPGVWRIGTLYIELGSVPSPGPDVELICGHTIGGRFEIGQDGCIHLETAAATHPLAVYATATGSCSEPTIDALSLSYPEWPEPQFRGPLMTPADLEAGAFHIGAFIWNYGGYAGSEATAPVQFKPEVTLPPDC